MVLTTRCLDRGTRTQRSRCTRRRDDARSNTQTQRARLTISRQQRRRVYARDGHRCLDCGTTAALTLDHIVPLKHQVKPYFRDDDRATRCRSCNASRGATRS